MVFYREVVDCPNDKILRGLHGHHLVRILFRQHVQLRQPQRTRRANRHLHERAQHNDTGPTGVLLATDGRERDFQRAGQGGFLLGELHVKFACNICVVLDANHVDAFRLYAATPAHIKLHKLKSPSHICAFLPKASSWRYHSQVVRNMVYFLRSQLVVISE